MLLDNVNIISHLDVLKEILCKHKILGEIWVCCGIKISFSCSWFPRRWGAGYSNVPPLIWSFSSQGWELTVPRLGHTISPRSCILIKNKVKRKVVATLSPNCPNLRRSVTSVSVTSRIPWPKAYARWALTTELRKNKSPLSNWSPINLEVSMLAVSKNLPVSLLWPLNISIFPHSASEMSASPRLDHSGSWKYIVNGVIINARIGLLAIVNYDLHMSKKKIHSEFGMRWGAGIGLKEQHIQSCVGRIFKLFN